MRWRIIGLGFSYAPTRIALTVLAGFVALIVAFSAVRPAMLMNMVHALMSMG